ncbi:MAG: hypothetical protein ACXAEN_18110 [Candidatus Thorarchaeota archaeon]|jgi:hypothetical protein
MDNKVIVRSINEHNEIEDAEIFEASEMKTAKAKATRWINENFFTDEITIEKDEVTPHYQKWNIS